MTKPLTDKLTLLVEQSSKCGSKYAPVTNLGSLAYADNGNLRVIMDNYLMKHLRSRAAGGCTSARWLYWLSHAKACADLRRMKHIHDGHILHSAWLGLPLPCRARSGSGLMRCGRCVC